MERGTYSSPYNRFNSRIILDDRENNIDRPSVIGYSIIIIIKIIIIRSTVTCWWEENGTVLVMVIEYEKKGVGACVETIHRSLLDVSILLSYNIPMFYFLIAPIRESNS